MKANMTVLWIAALALLTAGCGEVARSGRSPVQPVILLLQGASGADDSPEFAGTVLSDVETGGGVFNDIGQVAMTAILKDPGIPGIPSTPSPLNQITFTRYRVEYRRADGRNTHGVDVPYPFDSGLTFTVVVDQTTTVSFDLVRHNAKREAPLAALATSVVKITTIADVTFYGRDMAGNDVSITGSIGITFGQYADPE